VVQFDFRGCRVPYPSAVSKGRAVASLQKNIEYPTLAQNARMGHPSNSLRGYPPNSGETLANMRLSLIYSPQVLAVKRDAGLDIRNPDLII
jgi:hypothetical protein